MKCFIDQSGKVEDSSKLTVVAMVDGKIKSLLINSREKRKVLRIMREIEFPGRVFVYKIFAGLVFLLVKKERVNELFIDDEYPGHGPLIKDIIIKLFEGHKLKVPHINFGLIGKNNEAHKVALETFRGKRDADVIVNAKDVFGLFYTK